MKKEKKNIKISRTLIIATIICIVAFALLIINNYCESSTISLTIAIAILILCFAGTFLAIRLIITTIVDMLRTWLDEYKTKSNLFVGALSFFLVSALIAIFIDGFGNAFAKENYEIYHSIANTFLSAIPGWFALLGVYYTANIQEKRRNVDFIISNTPYPLIELSAKNSKEKSVSIKVSNLADNILIPISIREKSLGYVPVTKTAFREFNNLKLSLFENNEEIYFFYEDANHRTYKTKLHINDALNGQSSEDYIIIENEKPILYEKEVSAEDSH